jgi:hypothetical protein
MAFMMDQINCRSERFDRVGRKKTKQERVNKDKGIMATPYQQKETPGIKFSCGAVEYIGIDLAAPAMPEG